MLGAFDRVRFLGRLTVRMPIGTAAGIVLYSLATLCCGACATSGPEQADEPSAHLSSVRELVAGRVVPMLVSAMKESPDLRRPVVVTCTESIASTRHARAEAAAFRTALVGACGRAGIAMADVEPWRWPRTASVTHGLACGTPPGAEVYLRFSLRSLGSGPGDRRREVRIWAESRTGALLPFSVTGVVTAPEHWSPLADDRVEPCGELGSPEWPLPPRPEVIAAFLASELSCATLLDGRRVREPGTAGLADLENYVVERLLGLLAEYNRGLAVLPRQAGEGAELQVAAYGGDGPRSLTISLLDHGRVEAAAAAWYDPGDGCPQQLVVEGSVRYQESAWALPQSSQEARAAVDALATALRGLGLEVRFNHGDHPAPAGWFDVAVAVERIPAPPPPFPRIKQVDGRLRCEVTVGGRVIFAEYFDAFRNANLTHGLSGWQLAHREAISAAAGMAASAVAEAVFTDRKIGEAP